jgi:hypothetical protein
MTSSQKESASILIAQTARWLIIGFGFIGAAFVVYGVITAKTGQPWPPLELIAEPLSVALTILGTLFTALSVYFFGPTETPPARMSTHITAPIVVAICLAGLAALAWYGHLPTVVVNGFAIIGLSGALQRMQPDPNLRQSQSK